MPPVSKGTPVTPVRFLPSPEREEYKYNHYCRDYDGNGNFLVCGVAFWLSARSGA